MSHSDDGVPKALSPLHPLLLEQAVARQLRPGYAAIGVAEARRIFMAGQADGYPGPALAAIEDQEIKTPQGALQIRVYYPTARPGARLVLYFHGGGFVFGNLDSHDRNVRRLAAASGAVVVSVDYRLAPEFPFPAGMEDALFALRFIASASANFVRTPPQVFVAGDSAGATLAIAAALALAEEGGPTLGGLLAFYPMLDLSNVGGTDSYAAFGDGRAGLSLADALWFRDQYTPDPTVRTNWRCSPLLSESLARLPPTLIIAAAHDVLRDEGTEFARRLRAAAVPVAHHVVDDVNHGFMGATATLPAISATLDVVSLWLQNTA
jgi:acetyl esterase